MNAHAAAVIAGVSAAADTAMKLAASLKPCRSVPAYTVAPETLTPHLGEFLALLAAHQPAGVPPFAPVVQTFKDLDSHGLASFVSLRNAAGRLVGCTFTHVFSCPHYQIITGGTDVLIAPEGASAADATSMLLDATEAELKRLGVQRWFLREGLDAMHAVSPDKHGFKAVEQQHAKPMGA